MVMMIYFVVSVGFRFCLERTQKHRTIHGELSRQCGPAKKLHQERDPFPIITKEVEVGEKSKRIRIERSRAEARVG